MTETCQDQDFDIEKEPLLFHNIPNSSKTSKAS